MIDHLNPGARLVITMKAKELIHLDCSVIVKKLIKQFHITEEQAIIIIKDIKL